MKTNRLSLRRLKKKRTPRPQGEAEIREREERPAPVIEFEDSGFERIVDDETGDLLRMPIRQEAIIDKVRAVEFDMETTPAAEVGSLLGSVTDDQNGFERIADEDDDTQPAPAKAKGRGGKSAKSKAAGKGTRENEKQHPQIACKRQSRFEIQSC